MNLKTNQQTLFFYREEGTNNFFAADCARKALIEENRVEKQKHVFLFRNLFVKSLARDGDGSAVVNFLAAAGARSQRT